MEKKEDLISRQAAIDTLADMKCKSDEDGYVWIIRSDAWARIDALPSAQPLLEEFEWCTSCKEYDQKNHCCHRLTKVILQTVEELKAQPQRMRGRWGEWHENKIDSMTAKSRYCSCCGNLAVTSIDIHGAGLVTIKYNFCPHCGADMREGQE